MAKKRYEPNPVTPPSISPEGGRKLIQALVERGKLLVSSRPINEAKFDAWNTSAEEAIRKTFGSDTNHLSSFYGSPGVIYLGSGYDDEESEEGRRFDRLNQKIQVLESLVEEIDFQVGIETSTAPTNAKAELPSGKNVFIVHGHDDDNLGKLRDMLISEFHLNPIVMKSEPDQSRTVIQKFTEEAEKCSFAFVLLTPDDQVSSTAGGYVQARPNVVFELGWFWARLGPKRILMLLKKGTKIHSDLDGVLRKDFSESVEEKFLEIKRELQAVGIF